MKKIILDLCAGSGSWSKPYEDAGYRVIKITLPDYDIMNVIYTPKRIHFISDRLAPISVWKEEVYGVLAAPPCTEFSIAKDHTIKRDLKEGMKIVNKCIEIIHRTSAKFYCIENPVGYLKDFLGTPVYTFQPWWFGDGWSKRTMLWGKFNPPTQIYKKFTECPQIEGLYIRPGRKVPSIAFNHKNHKKLIRAFDPFKAETDADFRAITSPAFARAFFKANP